ncbi:hypothetical protein A0H81_03915 [Grifola frondosa]|uniref:DUF6534 domain-containing protein n=1 Tax=Grifola frondosa TaxID=5627 RepID=A0A1C7MIP4_GRIFR|nr:hypothetical protein A0H81_03915 [Grifola frondosa]
MDEDFQVKLNETVGASFIGYCIALFLYGVTTAQVILYLRRKNHIPWLLGIVITLWILDNVHVAGVSIDIYTYVITRHGDIKDFLNPLWSFGLVVITSVITNLIVRWFVSLTGAYGFAVFDCMFSARSVYAYRIWKFSGGNRFVPLLVFALSIFILVTGLLFAAHELRFSSMMSSEYVLAWSLYAAYGTEIVVDVIITVSMIISLWRFRPNLRRPEYGVQSLIMYSVNTGLLSTYRSPLPLQSNGSLICLYRLCVGSSLLTYIFAPNTFAFIAIYFILSKLHINALLGTLNAQASFARKANQTHVDNTGMPCLTTAIVIQGEDSMAILSTREFESARGNAGGRDSEIALLNRCP